MHRIIFTILIACAITLGMNNSAYAYNKDSYTPSSDAIKENEEKPFNQDHLFVLLKGEKANIFSSGGFSPPQCIDLDAYNKCIYTNHYNIKIRDELTNVWLNKIYSFDGYKDLPFLKDRIRKELNFIFDHYYLSTGDMNVINSLSAKTWINYLILGTNYIVNSWHAGDEEAKKQILETYANQ